MKKQTRQDFLKAGGAAMLGGGYLASSAGKAKANESSRVQWTSISASAVHEPVIPAQDFLITNYGAAGDGRTDSLPAIMAAIEDACQAGGGRVVIPAGEWFSKGPIHLQSKIDLHVSEGARLLFSPEPSDYLPVVPTRWEGTELYGYSPLIYANGVHDVAITGAGTLDGNENSVFHSWAADEKQEDDQLALRRMGIDGTPVNQRVFGPGTFLRPSMVQFFHAERVLLEDYTIHNSPFWINHLVYTKHATVRRLTVDSHRANNDGVDIDSTSYAVVENNLFRTGDDSVVVKSGRDADGRRVGIPSEHVLVQNNDMGGEDGIALGSEMSGDVRYVYFVNNTLREGSSAIRFKGNFDRGGVVEHIAVRNFTVESFDTLFWFQLDYPGEMGGNYPPVYRDLVFSNFSVEKTGVMFEAHGPEGYPIRDVRLKDIEIGDVETPLIFDGIVNLTFDSVVFNEDVLNGSVSRTSLAS